MGLRQIAGLTTGIRKGYERAEAKEKEAWAFGEKKKKAGREQEAHEQLMSTRASAEKRAQAQEGRVAEKHPIEMDTARTTNRMRKLQLDSARASRDLENEGKRLGALTTIMKNQDEQSRLFRASLAKGETKIAAQYANMMEKIPNTNVHDFAIDRREDGTITAVRPLDADGNIVIDPTTNQPVVLAQRAFLDDITQMVEMGASYGKLYPKKVRAGTEGAYTGVADTKQVGQDEKYINTIIDKMKPSGPQGYGVDWGAKSLWLKGESNKNWKTGNFASKEAAIDAADKKYSAFSQRQSMTKLDRDDLWHSKADLAAMAKQVKDLWQYEDMPSEKKRQAIEAWLQGMGYSPEKIAEILAAGDFQFDSAEAETAISQQQQQQQPQFVRQGNQVFALQPDGSYKYSGEVDSGSLKEGQRTTTKSNGGS
jgi:hypothetical protein